MAVAKVAVYPINAQRCLMFNNPLPFVVAAGSNPFPLSAIVRVGRSVPLKEMVNESAVLYFNALLITSW